MKVFGLTGGIGMGKSASEKWLRDQGVPVVDTDEIARAIVEPGQPALREIAEVFGRELIDDHGRLRREQLARMAFGNPAARRKLEAITHPRIREVWRERIAVWRAERRPLAVVVIPLLFETGAEAEMDATICVACSAATQHRRLLARGWSEGEIQQRLAAQWPLEEKVALADYVVWTEGPLEITAIQLERILTRSKQ